jgi:hypothetical protein
MFLDRLPHVTPLQMRFRAAWNRHGSSLGMTTAGCSEPCLNGGGVGGNQDVEFAEGVADRATFEVRGQLPEFSFCEIILTLSSRIERCNA